MFTSTGNLSHGMHAMNNKLQVADQIRNESRKNWMLISQMKTDMINENRYMITKRQLISEALKETMRMNNALK